MNSNRRKRTASPCRSLRFATRSCPEREECPAIGALPSPLGENGVPVTMARPIQRDVVMRQVEVRLPDGRCVSSGSAGQHRRRPRAINANLSKLSDIRFPARGWLPRSRPSRSICHARSHLALQRSRSRRVVERHSPGRCRDSACTQTLDIDRRQHAYSDITNLQSIGRVGPEVALGSEPIAASENRRSTMGIEIASA